MPVDLDTEGWPWAEASGPPPASTDMAEAFRACFGTPSGRIVLDQLCRVFLRRRVPPSGSDAELRHVEGQRSVVAWMIGMATAPGSTERSHPHPGNRWINP